MRHKDSRPNPWPLYQRGRVVSLRRFPTIDLRVPPHPSKIPSAADRMTYMAHWRLCQMEQPGRGMLRVLND